MKALIKDAEGVRWREAPEPALEHEGDVKIRVTRAGICRTDLYVAAGQMEGAAPELVLGHELSGTIAATGPGAPSQLRIGQAVTAHPLLGCGTCGPCARGSSRCVAPRMLGVDRDGAFAEYVVVPGRLVHALPPGLTPEQGAYAEPVAASLAVGQAGLDPAGRGLLYGGGRIAALTHRILEAVGLGRVTWVEALEALEDMPSARFDWAIETHATARSLQALMRAVAPGGTIVLKSRPAAPVPLDLQRAVRQAITLRAVDYGPYDRALELMASGALAVDDLFGPVHHPRDFAAVFARLRQDESTKHFFDLSAVGGS